MTLLALRIDRPYPLLAAVSALPRTVTAAQAGYATSTMIAVGILVSIATTPDPLWWQLHFSQLGTFHVFSGVAFNSTIVVSGAMVVYFATRLRAEMTKHAGSELLTNRRAATIVPLLVGVIGVHLSVIGLFPLNVNEFMHDRGPQGALLAFVGILASRRWVLRGMHRDVAKVTRRVVVALSISTLGFAMGWFNLALFELLVFGLMFVWFLMLARNIGRPCADSAPDPETTATATDAPRRHTTAHEALPLRLRNRRPSITSVRRMVLAQRVLEPGRSLRQSHDAPIHRDRPPQGGRGAVPTWPRHGTSVMAQQTLARASWR